MRNSETFKISTRGDRELVITREFDAPRHLVFDAFTKPELVRRWLLGPDGWTMPVCEIDLRVGGSYRYVWRHASGNEMGMGGVFREIVPPERIVSTEKFDHAWYPGEAIGTIVLTERAGKTTLTQIVAYQSAEALQEVLKSPMESGVAAGYNRLEEILSSLPGGAK
ncbi:MAG: SRPBCC family protein [Acidobacteria bacterium]|nr:SRPBCC family protein [Acidobacteriota bacterium]